MVRIVEIEETACPAIGGTCYKCRKHGHFNSQCFTRSVSVVDSESVLESAFLGVVGSTNRKGWFLDLDICLEGKQTSFKLDAGAEVNAISEETLKTLPNTTLQKPTKCLYRANHKPLQRIGQFQCSLSRGDVSISQEVFVVRELTNNLFELPSIEALHLIQSVNEVYDQNYDHKIRRLSPSVFKGPGNLGEPYKIRLRPDAKPRSLYTPRHVPLPLQTKVKTELERMESLGVITKVEEATVVCKHGSGPLCGFKAIK